MRAAVTLLSLLTVGACDAPAAQAPAPESPHHHELHLPPPGAVVHVTLDGQSVDVELASVPHDGPTAPLGALFRAAWPMANVASLGFDLVGSDGFHPASRAPCAKPLTPAQVGAAHIDVVTHDVSFDDTVKLPGCYRVKAVVSMAGTR